MNICIVDDEEDIRYLLRDFIEENFQPEVIVEATNGNEALLKCETQKFDLVITDIKMPILRGPSFIKHLSRQKHEMLPDHILILSGFIDESLDIQSKVKNITYMAKPFKYDALSDYLEKEVQLKPKRAPRVQVTSDVSYINPFIESTLEVLDVLCGVEARKEAVFLRDEEDVRSDITAIIAMNSDKFKGSMGVCFEEGCFRYVYSEMLGEEISEIDNQNSDAVGEICNQIFGSAKAKFAEKGIKIAPAIPAVVYGPNHRVRYHVRGSCLSIEFNTDHGKFWVEAILKNN